MKSQQGLSIGHLDCLFKKLNYQRAIGERNEDISFVDIPWTSGARTEMEDLLIHHTFIGAGCGPFASGKQANSILEVGNVENLTTWKLINCFSTDEKRAYVKGKMGLVHLCHTEQRNVGRKLLYHQRTIGKNRF